MPSTQAKTTPTTTKSKQRVAVGGSYYYNTLREGNYDDDEDVAAVVGTPPPKSAFHPQREGDDNSSMKSDNKETGEGTSATMIRKSTNDNSDNDSSTNDAIKNYEEVKSWMLLKILVFIVVVDFIVALLLDTPLIPGLQPHIAFGDLSFSQSTLDLLLWYILRTILLCKGLYISYYQNGSPKMDPFVNLDKYNKDGTKKSIEELEEEALDESWIPYVIRFLKRPSFPIELVTFITIGWCFIKTLSRLYIEIVYEIEDSRNNHHNDDKNDHHTQSQHNHVAWWCDIALTSLICSLECWMISKCCALVATYGQYRREISLQRLLDSTNDNYVVVDDDNNNNSMNEDGLSSLSVPLLKKTMINGDDGINNNNNNEERASDYGFTTLVEKEEEEKKTDGTITTANKETSLVESLESNTGLLIDDSTKKDANGDDNDIDVPSPLFDKDDNKKELAAYGTNNTSDGVTSSSPDDEKDIVKPDITSEPTYKAGWSDLIHLLTPDLHFILLAFVFLLAAAIMQVAIPRLTGNALDALVDGDNNSSGGNRSSGTTNESYNDNGDNSDNDNGKTNGSGGGGGGGVWSSPDFITNIELLVVASILCGIFSAIRGSIFTVIGGRVNLRLRINLMKSLLTQDIGFFDVTKTGDITSRLCSDTTLVGDQVSLNVNVFLRSLVQAIGVLIFMFLISWQLTLLAFVSVPVITIFSSWYGAFIRTLTKLMQKKLADGNSISEAVLSSMPTVRAFGAAEYELNEYKRYMDKYLILNYKSAVAYMGWMISITALPQLVIALVLFYGGLLIQSNGPDHISKGQLVSFLLYLNSLADAFNSMGYIFAALTQAVGAADKVFELMHRKPRIRRPTSTTSTKNNSSNNNNNNEDDTVVNADEENGTLNLDDGADLSHNKKDSSNVLDDNNYGGITPDECVGQVVLDEVKMCYPARPNRPILNGMNIVAPPGCVVALVGPSGGGKSSIISLIQHLYEPYEGRILIDGNDVHELNTNWLSRHVSVVSQEPTLFGKSIKQNIMYGLEGTEYEPSMEDICHAATLANASTFIEQSLPQGYDTDVGERGVQLSGGQKQRIAIARALVRHPRVLLLDEATSALDAESEATVQEAIDTMLKRGSDKSSDGLGSMTVIVVAHRLSTVRNADIIYVIEHGKVVESGNHTTLIQNPNGPYSKLISRQIKSQQKMEGTGGDKETDEDASETKRSHADIF